MLVAVSHLEVLSVAWPPEISGVLVRRGEAITIGLNRSHSPERRHFSFWHEVGHWLLMHSAHAPCRSTYPGRAERQADLFATAMTMPEPWVRRLAADGAAADEMALRFRVSPRAMSRRIRELNLVA